MTTSTTLAKIPESRLSKLASNDAAYDTTLGAYVFERNSAIFSHILSAYTHGSLHLPHDICIAAVQEELNFWMIPTDLLSTSSWQRYK